MVGFQRWRVVVLVVLVVVAGCRQPADERPIGQTLDEVAVIDLEPARRPQTGAEGANPSCRLLLLDVGNPAAELATIEIVVDAVRSGECSSASPQHRMCRDLFLAAITDPIAGIGAGLDANQLERVAEQHRWVLADAREAAVALGDEGLVIALTELAALDVTTAMSAGDEAVVEIAIARADPAILGAVARAEQQCG